MRHFRLMPMIFLLAAAVGCSQSEPAATGAAPRPMPEPAKAPAVTVPPVIPAAVTGIEPVAYWRFDEVGGRIARDSASSRMHALAVGLASTAGVVDGAARFDGKQAHAAVRIPNDAEVGALEAWVRLAALPTVRQAVLATAGAGQGLVVLPGGQPCVTLPDTDGTYRNASGTAALPVGRWCHLVACIDLKGAGLVLYCDGIEVGRTALAGLGTLDRQLRLGGDGAAAGLAGDLDELRIWPRSLDAGEVARLTAWGRAGRSSLPDLQPDRSFTSATSPRETPPPVTPELTARILALPAASGEVVRATDGAPELRIDGMRATLLGGQQMVSNYARETIHIAPYRDGGIDLLMVSINCGFFHPEAGHQLRPGVYAPFWEGAGRFCADSLAPDLWRALSVHPEAALMVWLWINPYPAFAQEHPEAIIRNLAGDPLVVSSHYLRYDPKGPDPNPKKQEQFAISFHSEDFLRDGAVMCAELVKAVERTVPGRRVAGYLIGGGQDAQLYDWNPPDQVLSKDALTWGDFSPAARKAWGRWLQTRYGSAAAVAAAWGRPVADLATAPLPTAADLVGPATLHQPVTGRIVVDWNRFTAESRLRMLSAFATAAKGAASRPVVVGVPAGDGGARKDLAQAAPLLRDPAIDFLFHQPTYGQRQPGRLGGVGAHLASHSVNGKLFFADLDHPTWLVPDGRKGSIGVVSQTSGSQGRIPDATALAATWRRDLGALAAAGHGALVHPILGGPWMYTDPEVVAEFRFLETLLASTRPSPPASPAAGIASIYDERSISWLKGGLAGVHYAWMRGQQNELMSSGAPFTAYYAEDLEDGLVPPVPLILVQNQLAIGPQMAAALKKLQGGGRTLVFLQGTGWEQLSAGGQDAVEAATGIRLALRSAAQAVADRGDPAAIRLTDTAWALVGATGRQGGALLADMPPAVAWNPVPDLAMVDGPTLAGGVPGEGRGLRVRGSFTLAEAGVVSLQVRSDWWSTITIDGRPVVVVDRAVPGGSPEQPVWGRVALAAGVHQLEGQVVSGSNGFRLGLSLTRGEPPLGRLQTFDDDAQGVAVIDPRATVHGRYRDGTAAFAVVDHGTWRSVFVGSWTLSAALLNRFAAEAGAWTACPAGAAVVSRGGDLLVIHALVDGPIEITLPQAAALQPIGPGEASAAAVRHAITIRRGETRLFRVR